nr:5-formyltetrahydrofolate cyclo-ligase [Desulfobulbaceae bacterium]
MSSHITQTAQTERRKLRTQVLGARDALSMQARQQKSDQILKALISHERFIQAKTIFSYINFRSEVITTSLIKLCPSLNKRLCAPLTLQKEFRLVPYEVANETLLQPGYWGIPEPDPLRHQPVAPEEIDLILLPGSVFDRFGGRLGYGGGFYDRFIVTMAPESITVGLAFDLQLVADPLPLLPHDQKLDYLITESTILNFTKDQL